MYWSDYGAMRDRYVRTTCHVVETKVLEKRRKGGVDYGPGFKVKYYPSARRLLDTVAPAGASRRTSSEFELAGWKGFPPSPPAAAVVRRTSSGSS